MADARGRAGTGESASASGGDDFQKHVREMLDRAAIADVMKRYARAIRKNDSRMMASCFTDDARLESNGQTLVGARAIERYYDEWFSSTMNGSGMFDMQRVVSTPFLANDAEILLNGDTATAESSGLAVHAGKRGEDGMVVVRAAYYEDEFVRTASGWKFSKRFHGNHWASEFPARIVAK